MNNNPTLLILAAGMATRYGSLKQLEEFGPGGETIIDYSIYDALRAGFGKVVFVIRRSIEKEFKDVMLHRFADKIEVDFVLQELDDLPECFDKLENREKPWGTGHAVWTAKSKINEPFAVINADDFYGYRSFELIASFLKNTTDERQYGLIGYQLKNTLSPHGAVSRGICEISDDGYLESITEQIHIVQTKTGIELRNEDNQQISLEGDEIVSMNLMGFTPSVFPHFESCFKEFLNTKRHESPKVEFYLPEVVNRLVKTGGASVKVLHTPEKWFGVTFPNDKPVAIEALKSLIADGVYPENLWASSKI